MTATEYVVLVDSNNKQIGTAEKMIAHQQNLLHRAFSVFLFRHSATKTELLLQQRALTKYHSAGLWTNTCCSHPRVDEDIVLGGQRRLKEELGIDATLREVGTFHYNARFENGLSENEMDHVLVGDVDKTITPILNPEEVNAFSWTTIKALHKELEEHPEKFTYWFQQALQIAIQA